ncbi:MAG TPA: hypothetical protein VK402_18065 [Blastococcus sp.]|nr:hypothetical protein [Blastococcus sp.]
MARVVEDPENVHCWCCGRFRGEQDVVRLGDHPEVRVCLGCAHFLHQRATAREDSLRPSPGARARNALRAGRGFVMQRGWQDKRVLGPLLRRLDRRLP